MAQVQAANLNDRVSDYLDTETVEVVQSGGSGHITVLRRLAFILFDNLRSVAVNVRFLNRQQGPYGDAKAVDLKGVLVLAERLKGSEGLLQMRE
jgi:ABC-type histidine transport system ATPase subunit